MADDDKLTMTEGLVLDQIAARRRLGEPFWTFERTPAMTKVLKRLAETGYLTYEGDPAGNWRVWINEDPEGPAAKWAVPVGERCYRDHLDDDWKPTPPIECPPPLIEPLDVQIDPEPPSGGLLVTVGLLGTMFGAAVAAIIAVLT